MRTVISTIALKFLQKGGSEFISLSPLVSKPAPEWLPKQKEFTEARDKGFVSLSGDAENGNQNLDKELVRLATKLEVAFTAEMPQFKLEELVKVAGERKDSMIEQIRSAGGSATANMKPSTLEASLQALKESGASKSTVKTTQTLDSELLKKATALEVVFTAEITQPDLETLVSDAGKRKDELIKDIKEANGDANESMNFATLESKLDELTK